MQAFTYWIQHADFTTTDGQPVTVEAAIQAFSSHDWALELSTAKGLHAAGSGEVCPPGIGFHPVEEGSDLLLHIKPVSWDKADVDYQFPEQRKRLFGLVSPMLVIASMTATGFPIERAAEAIRLFMAARHPELLVLLQRH
ncbi:hypothetical protein [Orrella dioscoreae]|uniref:Uncharacterized protein n=2 Tax=root TaxID=1 RepID=A0A1C3K2T7_9BURK|nr:hypothetical protein [Orrella dioscoreae]SBT25754.1 hypothetical protein ODI_01381 [Orrella dioscoreae]SOE52051.1 hypothetical protein ODI_R3884 [Orrella dioscoreae]